MTFQEKIDIRLRKEFEELRDANMKCVWDIQLVDENIRKWKVLLLPDRAPYSRGAFWVEIDITADFPFRPPLILFLTKIYHPSVDEEGYFHFPDVYWRHSTEMENILRTVVFSLRDRRLPSSISSARWELSRKYKRNSVEFMKKAEEMVEEFSERRPPEGAIERRISKENDIVASKLRKELLYVQKENLKQFRNIHADDIWTWKGLIVPDCAPYSKGVFRFEIYISSEYPFRPVKIFFRTKIYHPNVSEKGEVEMRGTCIGCHMLFVLRMDVVLKTLAELLKKPDENHFTTYSKGDKQYRERVIEQYRKRREEFLKTAEEFSERYAEKLPADSEYEPEGRCMPFLRTPQATEPENKYSFPEMLVEGNCPETM